MLKQTTPPILDNRQQLYIGLVASLKLLLVSLSLVVLFVVLFVKSIVSFAMVVLAALNMVAEWIVSLVAQSDEVASFFASVTR